MMDVLSGLAEIVLALGAIFVVIFIILVSLMYWGMSQNKYYKGFQERKKLLANTRRDRIKNEGPSISYEEFVKPFKKKFKLPNDIRTLEEVRDSRVSPKKLDDFLSWISRISGEKDRGCNLKKLLASGDKLNVSLPSSLTINFRLIEKTNGSVQRDELDYDLSVYMITVGLSRVYGFDLTNKEWAKVLNNPVVDMGVLNEIFGEGTGWDGWDTVEDEGYYLEDGDFELPYDEYWEEFEERISGANLSGGPIADGSYNLYCTQNVDFWKKDISINGKHFRFKENEKDYLLVLLMATYKPKLLRKIREALSIN